MTEVLCWLVILAGICGAYAIVASIFDSLAERQIQRRIDAACGMVGT